MKKIAPKTAPKAAPKPVAAVSKGIKTMNDTVKKFADEADIAEWAAEAVEQLTGTSIIQGITETNFGPLENASRAQSAVMLKRVLQALHFINP